MEKLNDQIKRYLTKNPGSRAKIIAAVLGVSRHEINRILYSNVGVEYDQDANWGWHIIGNSKKLITSTNNKVVAAIKTLHGITNLLLEADDEVFAFVNVSDENKQEVTAYLLDITIITFYFDLVMDEDEYYDLDEDQFNDFYNEYASLLSPSLSSSSLVDKFDGFFTRENSVPSVLAYIVDFDLKYTTNYAELFVKCFHMLAEAISETYDICEDNIWTYDDHIEYLVKYVTGRKQNESTQKIQEKVDDVDDEDDLFDDISEDSDYDDELPEDIETIHDHEHHKMESEDSKIEIIEDCTTCVHRHRCQRAFRNILCDSFVYDDGSSKRI